MGCGEWPQLSALKSSLLPGSVVRELRDEP